MSSPETQYFVLLQLGTKRKPLWKVAEAGAITERAVAQRLAAVMPTSYKAIVVMRLHVND